MSIQKRFTDQDFERIKATVKEAESKISGEIVPVFVERSGFYTIANYRAAMIGASFFFLIIILVDRYMPWLAVYDPLFIFLVVAVGATLGAAIPHLSQPANRWFVNQKHLDEATRKKAENAFHQEQTCNTRTQTAIR